MTQEDLWKLIVPLACIVVVVIAALTCSCTDESRVRRSLEEQGFKHIQIYERASFACSGFRVFGTRFTAVNSKGVKVEGLIDAGNVMNCTVRF